MHLEKSVVGSKWKSDEYCWKRREGDGMLALVLFHGKDFIEVCFYVGGITLNFAASLNTWEKKADRMWNMLAKEFEIE